MEAPESKKFYGSVTVSERGQIVIPIDARKDFGIKTGDKLLVFGDPERGIGIATRLPHFFVKSSSNRAFRGHYNFLIM